MSNFSTINLVTSDGWELSANYYKAPGNLAVILLHQFRLDKSSMNNLALRLQKEGFNVLAVDLRGHGQSQGRYMDFTDKDFANMFYDAMAADEFLRKENPHMRVQMLGASIGANVALRYQEMNTLDSIILLSPGLNYHGLKTEDANLGNIATPALYLCSQGDQSAADTIHLFESSSLTEENKKLINYLGDKHGIFFVDDNPQAVDDVVAWLKERSGQPEIS